MTEQQNDAPATEPEDPTDEQAVSVTNWEFISRVPTRPEVDALLETLPPVWGVKTVDYGDYVQGLPQKKKTDVPHPDPEQAAKGVKVTETIQTYSLYMSVAGRIKMLEAAAEKNGWTVSFVPEPQTPTGIPGFLQNDDRIVYREYVAIEKHVNNAGNLIEQPTVLGRKPGMAWVPSSGGQNAAGSNPYEKVETSARGRAIAAWGFGVLPGSGVASLEEVIGAGQNRSAMRAQGMVGGRQQATNEREPRDELLASTLEVAEKLRLERGIEVDEANEKTAKYLSEQLGVRSVWNAEDKTIDWAKVKDGQLVILRNNLRTALAKLLDERSQV